MQIVEVRPWTGNKTAKRTEKRFDAILLKPYVLKLCPFCAGRGQLEHTWTASYWIECEDCGAQVSSTWTGNAASEAGHRRSALSAIDAWNRRV